MNRMYQVACIATLVWAISAPNAQSQTSTLPRDPYVDGLCKFGADLGNCINKDYNPGEEGETGRILTRMSNIWDDNLNIIQTQLNRPGEKGYTYFYNFDEGEEYNGEIMSITDFEPYTILTHHYIDEDGTEWDYYTPGGIVNEATTGQVLLTFPFNSMPYNPDQDQWGQEYSIDDTSAAIQYGIFAREVLKHINIQNPSQLDRVFAIEIGAEQEADGRWLDNASSDPQTTWFGSFHEGEKWADMHIAVKEELLSYPGLCDVDIIGGGSIQSHDTLNTDYVYDTEKTQMYAPEDLDIRRNGCAREFVEGFVSRIYNYNNLTNYNVLPEYIGIHGFIGKGNPEGSYDLTTDPEKPKTYTSRRLQELIDICDDATVSSSSHSNWIPKFCVTDYCFAGGEYSESNYGAYAPLDGASEEKQAVYFLRAQLIYANSVGKYKKNNVTKYAGWSACSYYHHTFSGSHDCGFFNYVPSGSASSSRIIRKISKNLYEPARNIELNELSTLGYQIQQSTQGTDRIAHCSWVKENGDAVFAVWRFSESNNYYDPVPAERSFLTVGDFVNDYELVEAKKFKLDNTIDVFDNLTIGVDTNVELQGYVSRITVQVDENPVFLVFEER